ncbi:MAG: L-rhamnose mutarotase, partial [Acidobacteria bacterium]
MRPIGSIIGLRPESEVQYRALHRHVFPGVLERISRSNIRNYSIFLRDGVLFSHLEYVGADHARDMAAIAADPVTREWWSLTDPLQVPLEEREPGAWWATMRPWHEQVDHQPRQASPRGGASSTSSFYGQGAGPDGRVNRAPRAGRSGPGVGRRGVRGRSARPRRRRC